MPGTVVGGRDTLLNKTDKDKALMELMFQYQRLTLSKNK